MAVREKLREAERAQVELQSVGEPPLYWKEDRLADVHDDIDFPAKLKLRLADAEEELNSDLRRALSRGDLVAFGRPRSVMAPPVLIPKDVWPALTVFDFGTSAAGENRSGGEVFFAVAVFPMLIAPQRVQLIGTMPLAEVLKRFVFGDPEVATWAHEGIKRAPEFARIFRDGRCFVHGTAEWPVAAERWSTIGYLHPDPEKQSVYDPPGEPSPIEIVDAGEALLERYQALIEILRSAEIDAFGMTEGNGEVQKVPTSIWSHEEFYVSAKGDVLQENQNCTNPRINGLIRRWTAVELRAPEVKASPAFHVNSMTRDGIPPSTTGERKLTNIQGSRPRRTPRADAVVIALKRARLTKRPTGLTNKEIAARIAPFMADERMSAEALAKAVARHFKSR